MVKRGWGGSGQGKRLGGAGTGSSDIIINHAGSESDYGAVAITQPPCQQHCTLRPKGLSLGPRC
jgi:hypothetical protein